MNKTILEQMEELMHMTDHKDAHKKADWLLCKALMNHGEHDLVDAWVRIERWYA